MRLGIVWNEQKTWRTAASQLLKRKTFDKNDKGLTGVLSLAGS